MTVAVLSRDLPTQARFCLWSLQQALALIKPFCNCGLVLVDNGSYWPYQKNDIENMEIDLIRQDFPRSWAAAVNFIRSHYTSEFYFVLDQNVLVPPHMLDELISFCRMEPKAGVIAPRLMNPDGTTYQAGLTLSRRGPVTEKKCRWPEPKQVFRKEAQAVGGECILVRGQVLAELGGLNELAGLADIDLCLRARQLGWRVFCLQHVSALCLAPAGWKTLKRSWSDVRRFRRRWAGRYTLDRL